MNIERSFVSLSNGNQVHYRTAGCGAPLVMLHPSPQSSETLIPAIAKFSEYCTCFALDTPGYGLSDDIDVDEPEIGDYVAPIMEAITNLGIDQFCLYGSATGGQIGIELAKRFPKRITMLMLDTNGHLTDDEIKNTMDGYFPEVEPKRDGRHLLTYWDMVRHLYVTFPWNSEREDDRINIDLPPAEMIHTIFIRYLRAGATYAKAYKAALKTEHIGHIKDLVVPTTILRWQGSIILDVTDALIDQGLSDNFIILNAGPTLDERYQVQLEALRELYTSNPEINAKININNDINKLSQHIYNKENYSIRYLKKGDPNNRPLILIAELGQSANSITEIADNIASEYVVYAIDLPWHGESSSAGEKVSLVDIVMPIKNLIDDLQLEQPDIVAFGSGGIVALELKNEVSVNKTTIIDPLPVDETGNKDEFDIFPKIDGAHIPAVWARIRDSEIYWPWNQHKSENFRPGNANLDPEYLHDKAVDLFKTCYVLKELNSIEQSYDWAKNLKNTESRIQLATTERNPAPHLVKKLAGDDKQLTILPADLSRWANKLID